MSANPQLPEPTLLELLELCARDYEHLEHPLGSVVPYEFACRELADRLRAAATRLKREIELAAPSSEQWNSHVTAVLERINAGPLPVPSAPTCAEPRLEPCDVNHPVFTRVHCKRENGHGGYHQDGQNCWHDGSTTTRNPVPR